MGLERIALLIDPPGQPAYTITLQADTCRWTTAAAGGFGLFEATLPGWHDIPFLADIRATAGTRTIYEGQIEDAERTITTGDRTTQLRAFGHRRILDTTRIQETYRRLMTDWYVDDNLTGAGLITAQVQQGAGPDGEAGFHLAGTDQLITATAGAVGGGQYGRGFALNTKIARLKGTNIHEGSADFAPALNFGTAATLVELGYDTDYDVSFATATSSFFNFGVTELSSATYGPGDNITHYNVRLIGSGVGDEDLDGGLSGGIIVRALIAQVAQGLSPGRVDAGVEFPIGHLDRIDTPSFAITVLEEVNAYHGRNWGVWEDKRLDWTMPNELDWTIRTTDVDELRVQQSVENSAKLIYVGYQNAVTTLKDTAVAGATSPRNPYVKAGRSKDQVVQVSFPMTSRSAEALAAKLARDVADYPPVRGTLRLPADREIRDAAGRARRAWELRAGDTIMIPDLPAAEPLRAGRDGQTTFHAASCDVNLPERSVTVELDGNPSRSDVLLARLAAATKIITG